MTSAIKRAGFRTPNNDRRPIYYFELPPITGELADLREQVLGEVERCRQCGCGTLIPQLPFGTELDRSGLMLVKELYHLILTKAQELGLFVGFYLDPCFEHGVIHAMGEIDDHSLRAKLLTCREYVCERGQITKQRLSPGKRLSLVAFDEEACDLIDLRAFVQDGVLVWEVPQGNYIIKEYLLSEDMDREGANYLSYEASLGYIRGVFSLFADTFAPFLGNTLSLISYSGVGFHGQNRRTWDSSFNRVFEERFGFDPAPYYPALFSAIGKDTEHLKACFMTVRASLLQNGILRALHDFAKEMGLTPFGNLSEPKLTACSFSMGDAMLNNAYSPCALYDKAYMYGTNSVKIAAGAAYNFDVDRVNAELFRNYASFDRDRLYRDALNAFARGANCTAVHLPPDMTGNSEFCDLVARVQTMLQGGRHVADIAMLYPIYHLHCRSGLYFSEAKGYEYPSTPSTADYMTLINSISIYSGHDLTLLHPDILNTRCHAENGVLYLDNLHNKEQFRVLVLPATYMISLQNLRTLKDFYDGGGKILATGVLPKQAFEYDPNGKNDQEVRDLVREIFGDEACDPMRMQDYCYHKNDKGGEAYFLYFNASAADGTRMTRSSTVNQALISFALPLDIYLPGMPRLEITGALNSIYPEFHTIGLHRTMPGGGMLNHIHKRYDDCDIYYFSNTTQADYNHHVLLRGAFEIEEWNPHTGEITERHSKLLSYRGELYTTLRLTLKQCSSTFFHAVPLKEIPAEVEKISSIKHLQSEHAALMSEF
ncbi:MAG: hypothetical protein E7590_02335 [Ruminococcaceae bacterium]|nr:hypothetical protein [Oscillospiraceae bacterium]